MAGVAVVTLLASPPFPSGPFMLFFRPFLFVSSVAEHGLKSRKQLAVNLTVNRCRTLLQHSFKPPSAIQAKRLLLFVEKYGQPLVSQVISKVGEKTTSRLLNNSSFVKKLKSDEGACMECLDSLMKSYGEEYAIRLMPCHQI